jgi:hypothetical protein
MRRWVTASTTRRHTRLNSDTSKPGTALDMRYEEADRAMNKLGNITNQTSLQL